MGCNHSNFVQEAIPSEISESSISSTIDIQSNELLIPTNAAHSTTTAANMIIVDHDHVNLESHQLVWLDEKTVTIENLRQIVDYTKLFDNVEACQQYLQNSKDHKNIFLVTSGQSGEKLIPEVHGLQNVLVIYVYCQDREYHQKWASEYQKVKKIHTVLDQLLMDLKEDVEHYLTSQRGKASGIPSKSQKSTADSFAWCTRLCNILVHFPFPPSCQHRLVNFLKDYYKDNGAELKLVQEFERDYQPDKAVWWYTREAFVYRMLNCALRQCDIKIIVLFGFYIRDLYCQLKEEHDKFLLRYPKDSIIKCYRGQVMSNAELSELNFNEGGPKTIVNTSLFSTSINRDVPSLFLSTATHTEELEYVIFEIDIDTRLQTRPFAEISHLSACSDESEVLFMIGTWLLIEKNSVSYSYQNNKKIWTVKSTLIDDWQLKYEQYLEMTTPRETLQKCLRRISLHIYEASVDDLKVVFNELIESYPSERWISAVKDESLGDNQSEIGHNRSTALAHYQKALEIWSEYVNDDELNVDYDMVRIYLKLATNNNDSQLIMKYCDLAITHSRLAFAGVSTNYERYRLLGWMADIYGKKRNVSTDQSKKSEYLLAAIKYKELQIKSLIKLQCTTLVGNYDNLAILCYEKLGILYESVPKYDQMIANFEKALEFELRKSVTDYATINRLTSKLFFICRDRTHDYDVAFKYQSLQHEHLLKFHAENPAKDHIHQANRNHTLAVNYAALGDLCRSLQRYELAAEYIKKSIKYYGDSLYYDRYELMDAHESELEEINMLIASSTTNKDMGGE